MPYEKINTINYPVLSVLGKTWKEIDPRNAAPNFKKNIDVLDICYEDGNTCYQSAEVEKTFDKMKDALSGNIVFLDGDDTDNLENIDLSEAYDVCAETIGADAYLEDVGLVILDDTVKCKVSGMYIWRWDEGTMQVITIVLYGKYPCFATYFGMRQGENAKECESGHSCRNQASLPDHLLQAHKHINKDELERQFNRKMIFRMSDLVMSYVAMNLSEHIVHDALPAKSELTHFGRKFHSYNYSNYDIKYILGLNKYRKHLGMNVPTCVTPLHEYDIYAEDVDPRIWGLLHTVKLDSTIAKGLRSIHGSLSYIGVMVVPCKVGSQIANTKLYIARTEDDMVFLWGNLNTVHESLLSIEN